MERKDSSENPMLGKKSSLLHDMKEVQDHEHSIDIIRRESGVYSDNSFLPEEKMKDREEYSSTATTTEKIVATDNTGTCSIPRRRKRSSSSSSCNTITRKGDRSKTLISERKRRGSMKKKLNELRALLPTITKMDTIIGDAALYVQELQMRVMELEAQTGSLEESEVDKPQEPFYQPRKKTRAVNSYSESKTIIKMEVVQVGERRFYVELVCNKGQAMVISLYKVLESFTSLNVESSSLVTVNDTFELTFTLKAEELEMNSEKLKLWVADAFFNHGFEFKT